MNDNTSKNGDASRHGTTTALFGKELFVAGEALAQRRERRLQSLRAREREPEGDQHREERDATGHRETFIAEDELRDEVKIEGETRGKRHHARDEQNARDVDDSG